MMDVRRNLTWRKSTKSAGGNCVEIAESGNNVHLRDSTDPAGPVLTFSRAAFRAFVADVKFVPDN
jgi:hypothetical protein